jgi:hypothetical protein
VQFNGPRLEFPNCMQFSGRTAKEALDHMNSKIYASGGLVPYNPNVWPSTPRFVPCVLVNIDPARPGGA